MNDKYILGYKKFIKEENYCIEHELEIDNIDKMKSILADLRIDEAFTLKKKRLTFYLNDYIEVDLDLVENLGFFVELEIKNNGDIAECKKSINDFLNRFKIDESMRNTDGYAYLLFNMNNG